MDEMGLASSEAWRPAARSGRAASGAEPLGRAPPLTREFRERI
jgi:hypothetical protein